MSLQCSMDPEREITAAREIQQHIRIGDGRSSRKHIGVFDDLRTRITRLEAVAAEQAVLIQALIDRRAS